MPRTTIFDTSLHLSLPSLLLPTATVVIMVLTLAPSFLSAHRHITLPALHGSQKSTYMTYGNERATVPTIPPLLSPHTQWANKTNITSVISITTKHIKRAIIALEDGQKAHNNKYRIK